MESQPQKPEYRINPENFHPCNTQILSLILDVFMHNTPPNFYIILLHDFNN